MSSGLDALQCSYDDVLIPDLIILLKNILPDRTFIVTQQGFYHDFADTGETSASLSTSTGTQQQCGDQHLLNLQEFVLQEASTGFKEYIDIFGSILNGKLILNAARNLGFAPVYNTLVKIRLHQSQLDSLENGGGEGGGGEGEGGGGGEGGDKRGLGAGEDRGGGEGGGGENIENAVEDGSNISESIRVTDGTDGSEYRIEAGGGSGMGFQLLCDGVMVLTAGGGGGGMIRNIHFISYS
jgi:hypothetical protein